MAGGRLRFICYSSTSAAASSSTSLQEEDESTANAIFASILFSRAINATRPLLVIIHSQSLAGWLGLWHSPAVQINVIADLQTCSDEARAPVCLLDCVLVWEEEWECKGKQNT